MSITTPHAIKRSIRGVLVRWSDDMRKLAGRNWIGCDEVRSTGRNGTYYCVPAVQRNRLTMMKLLKLLCYEYVPN